VTFKLAHTMVITISWMEKDLQDQWTICFILRRVLMVLEVV